MRIYLAGPISGRVPEAYAEFARVAATLRSRGLEVVSPCEIHPEAERLPPDELEAWEYYMKIDIPYMLRCDAVYFLPGWRGSRGCRLEHIIAADLGISVVELESDC